MWQSALLWKQYEAVTVLSDRYREFPEFIVLLIHSYLQLMLICDEDRNDKEVTSQVMWLPVSTTWLVLGLEKTA
jgi:hypothetical protein